MIYRKSIKFRINLLNINNYVNTIFNFLSTPEFLTFLTLNVTYMLKSLVYLVNLLGLPNSSVRN
jgi:hypothetical protein